MLQIDTIKFIHEVLKSADTGRGFDTTVILERISGARIECDSVYEKDALKHLMFFGDMYPSSTQWLRAFYECIDGSLNGVNTEVELPYAILSSMSMFYVCIIICDILGIEVALKIVPFRHPSEKHAVAVLKSHPYKTVNE